jgi:hypothetical protein
MTPEHLRRQVRERAQGLCEYCLCPADLTSAPFHCEHIQPRNAGGETTLDNLAWSCPSCNGHKYTHTHAIDSQSGRRVPLFHPRRQKWKRHFAWSADFLHIVGRTQTGRATVEALQMNRPELVNLRRMLHLIGEHPPEME